MKRVLAATCFAVAGAVAFAAQPPYKQEPPKGKAPTVAKEKTATVTGCLRAGDQPGTFVLENVKTEAAKGETVGTTGIAPGSTLRLIGAPAKMDLKTHVGHTVEFTGMIVPRGPKDRPTIPPEPPTPTARGAAEMQRLNVKTMKHISEKCPM